MNLFDEIMNGAQQELETRAAFADTKPTYEGGGEDIRWWNFSAGQALGRYTFGMFIVPFRAAKGGVKFFHVVFTHMGIFPKTETDNGNRKCIEMTCPESQIECPFCAVIRSEVEKRNTKESKKEVYKLKASGKAYLNALPISARNQPVDREKIPYAPHVVRIPEKKYDEIAQKLRDQQALNNPAINPLNPKNAAQLIVTVERIGDRQMDIRYNCDFGLARSPIADSDEDIEQLVSMAYDLTSIFKAPSDEEISKYRSEAPKLAQRLAEARGGQVQESAPVQQQPVHTSVAPATGPVAGPKTRTIKEPSNFQQG